MTVIWFFFSDEYCIFIVRVLYKIDDYFTLYCNSDLNLNLAISNFKTCQFCYEFFEY